MLNIHGKVTFPYRLITHYVFRDFKLIWSSISGQPISETGKSFSWRKCIFSWIFVISLVVMIGLLLPYAVLISVDRPEINEIRKLLSTTGQRIELLKPHLAFPMAQFSLLRKQMLVHLRNLSKTLSDSNLGSIYLNSVGEILSKISDNKSAIEYTSTLVKSMTYYSLHWVCWWGGWVLPIRPYSVALGEYTMGACSQTISAVFSCLDKTFLVLFGVIAVPFSIASTFTSVRMVRKLVPLGTIPTTLALTIATHSFLFFGVEQIPNYNLSTQQFRAVQILCDLVVVASGLLGNLITLTKNTNKLPAKLKFTETFGDIVIPRDRFSLQCGISPYGDTSQIVGEDNLENEETARRSQEFSIQQDISCVEKDRSTNANDHLRIREESGIHSCRDLSSKESTAKENYIINGNCRTSNPPIIPEENSQSSDYEDSNQNETNTDRSTLQSIYATANQNQTHSESEAGDSRTLIEDCSSEDPLSNCDEMKSPSSMKQTSPTTTSPSKQLGDDSDYSSILENIGIRHSGNITARNSICSRNCTRNSIPAQPSAPGYMTLSQNQKKNS